MSDPFAPLLERGIGRQTLAAFKVHATMRYCPVVRTTRPAYRYPIVAPTGELLGYHLKFADGRKPKYRWDGEPDAAALDQVYGLQTVRAGHAALLVEGFPDVWLMHTLDLPAAWLVSGVSSTPRSASIALLQGAQPSQVAVIYDNDAAGCSGAGRVVRALQNAGLTAIALALPASLPEHADITDLYAACGQDRERFMAALRSLQPHAVAAPAPTPAHAPRPVCGVRRSPYQEFKSSHRIEEVIADAITLKPEAGGRRLVGRCPFHDDSTPSFKVFVDDQRAYCFGCGWKGDVIAFLDAWTRRPLSPRAVIA